MVKERFGLLGIKGPKEKLFGGRRQGETRKEWKDRIAKEADLGSEANKQGLTKKDIGRKASGAVRTTVQTSAGTAQAVIGRDMVLVAAVDELEDNVVGIGADLSSIQARLEVLEAVQEEADDTIGTLGGGLGRIVSWLDPIVSGINATDVPTIPLAAQAGTFMTAWAANMDDRALFGLGKDAMLALGFGLKVLAYYNPAQGIGSLFQTDAGGILAGASAPAATSGEPDLT